MPYPPPDVVGGKQPHQSAQRNPDNPNPQVTSIHHRYDWPARFGHPLLLLEPFVDPARFRGTVYRAANWIEVGHSRGFGREGQGHSEHACPKPVFLHPPCSGPSGPGSGRPISTPARAMECRRRCRAPHRYDPFPRSSRTSTIPAAARGGAMPRPRCWHWPPPRRSAACAATRRSANGPTISAPRCCNASACAAAAGATGPAQPVGHPQPADPRRPGAARRRLASLTRGP